MTGNRSRGGLLAIARRLIDGARDALRELEDIQFDAPWKRDCSRC